MGRFINNVEVLSYNELTTYSKYDVVSITPETYPIYFVSAKDSNLGNLDANSYLSNSFWKRFDDPEFVINTVWTPSFQTSLKIEPKSRTVPLGDGYVQKVDSSIFFNKLSYEMSIDNCTTKESTSLLAFCEYKGGTDFIVANIPPFIVGRKFIAKNWRHTYVSHNINNFSVSLFEFSSDKNV